MQAGAEATVTQAETDLSTSAFAQLFSPTRRGVRLARLLTEQRLADWGQPRGGRAVQDAALTVAELAANAVQHGRVPDRDFRVTLTLRPDGALRIEVTDACTDRLPRPAPADPAGETGRGRLIVAALADRWGVDHCPDPPESKTVWAELAPPAAEDPGGASAVAGAGAGAITQGRKRWPSSVRSASRAISAPLISGSADHGGASVVHHAVTVHGEVGRNQGVLVWATYARDADASSARRRVVHPRHVVHRCHSGRARLISWSAARKGACSGNASVGNFRI